MFIDQQIIAKLHYIIPDIDDQRLLKKVDQACASGVEWLQLRIKNRSFENWLDIALKVKKIADLYQAKLIINDNVDITKQIDASGVHLGKDDISPLAARAILGDSSIIGCTVNTVEDIQRLCEQGVDYMGIGPFKSTLTKKKLSPLLGLDKMAYIIKRCKTLNIQIPLIAIGGIELDDLSDLFDAGVDGVAISSAITNSDADLFVQEVNRISNG